MGSGELRPASCCVLPPLSQLKQEEHSGEERQGKARVECVSNKGPTAYWSRFASHNRVLKNFGGVSLDSRGNVTPMLSSEFGMLPGKILSLL